MDDTAHITEHQVLVRMHDCGKTNKKPRIKKKSLIEYKCRRKCAARWQIFATHGTDTHCLISFAYSSRCIAIIDQTCALDMSVLVACNKLRKLPI